MISWLQRNLTVTHGHLYPDIGVCVCVCFEKKYCSFIFVHFIKNLWSILQWGRTDRWTWSLTYQKDYCFKRDLFGIDALVTVRFENQSVSRKINKWINKLTRNEVCASRDTYCKRKSTRKAHFKWRQHLGVISDLSVVQHYAAKVFMRSERRKNAVWMLATHAGNTHSNAPEWGNRPR